MSSEPQKPASASIPVVYALSGPLMALAAILPLLPDGRSFLRIVIDVLVRQPQDALMLIGFSTPFVLGLCLTALFWSAYEKQAEIQSVVEQILRSVVALLHAQFLLTSGQLWWASFGIVPGALFGVMVVCSVQLAIQSGQRVGVDVNGELDTPDTRLYVRWAMISLAAICAWMRLQAAGGFYFGWALEVLLGASVLTLWAIQSEVPKHDQKAHASPAGEEPSELPSEAAKPKASASKSSGAKDVEAKATKPPSVPVNGVIETEPTQNKAAQGAANEQIPKVAPTQAEKSAANGAAQGDSKPVEPAKPANSSSASSFEPKSKPEAETAKSKSSPDSKPNGDKKNPGHKK